MHCVAAHVGRHFPFNVTAGRSRRGDGLRSLPDHAQQPFSFHLLEPPQNRFTTTNGLDPYRLVGSNGDTGLDAPATSVVRIEMQFAALESHTSHQVCKPKLILFAIVSNREVARFRIGK